MLFDFKSAIILALVASISAAPTLTEENSSLEGKDDSDFLNLLLFTPRNCLGFYFKHPQCSPVPFQSRLIEEN